MTHYQSLLDTSQSLLKLASPSQKGVFLRVAIDSEDDEIDVLLAKQEQAKQITKQLKLKAQSALDDVTQKRDKYLEINNGFIDIRSSTYLLIDSSKAKSNQLTAHIKSLEARRMMLEKDINDIYKQLKNKEREAMTKKKNLEKYCWVPFYNIHLYSEYDSSLSNLKNSYVRFTDEKNNLHRELSAAYDKLVSCSADAAKTKFDLDFFDSQIAALTIYTTHYQRQTVQWNEIVHYYESLYNVVSNSTNLDFINKSVNETNAVIGTLQAEESKLKLSDIDYLAGRYDIKTTNKHGVKYYVGAITTPDNRKLVLGTEKSDISILPVVDTKCLGNIVKPTLDVMYLILDSSGNVITHPNNMLAFSQFNHLDRSYFWNIKGNGVYTICSIDSNYVWDVRLGSFAEKNCLWLYDRKNTEAQNFCIEPHV